MEEKNILYVTPTEFEKYCKDILMGYAEEEKLQKFSITHNIIIATDDGDYQIDVYATFWALGVEFKVLCECKHYSSPITREKVVILADKVRSVGAHKGILISTSKFQSGAIKYAKKHGIALIEAIDKDLIPRSYSDGKDTINKNSPFVIGFSMMPPYYAINRTNGLTVYPTGKMIREILMQMNEMIFGDRNYVDFDKYIKS